MLKRYALLFLFCTMLLTLFRGTASANPWVIDTTIHWSVSEICQDGYIAYAYDNRSGILLDLGTPQVDQRNLQAHLLKDNFLTTYPITTGEQNFLDEFGGFVTVNDVDLNAQADGPLGNALVLDIVQRPNPLFVDFSLGELVRWYDVDTLDWAQTVAVDKLVAVKSVESNRVFVGRVANCSLPQVGEIRRMSVDSAGVEGNAPSAEPSLSANGQRVAFSSLATNLVSNVSDINEASDIFIHSQRTDVTQHISLAGSLSQPVAAFGASSQPDIAYSGERVVFASLASDVALGNACDNFDDNGLSDVYRWDWSAAPRFSRLSLFNFYISGNFDHCSPLDAGTHRPRINQRDVTMSTATVFNSISQGSVHDPNGQYDVVLNRQGDGESIVASAHRLPTGGLQTGNGLSDYGDIAVQNRWVVFQTDATDLTASDSNGVTDVLLVDSTGLTTRAGNGELISVTSNDLQADGASQHPAISGTADHVAFDSVATNLHPDLPANTSQVYVRDRIWQCTILLSQSAEGKIGNGDSTFATISADGRYVAFSSLADNLVPNDTNAAADIFIVDRDADNDGMFLLDRFCTLDTWTIRRVSNGIRGMQSDGHSTEPDFSANGAWLAFTSSATNLVADDTNAVADVFVVFNGYATVGVPLRVGVVGVSADASLPPLLTVALVVFILAGCGARLTLNVRARPDNPLHR
jgi:Tol biopolymer transport system component